MSLGGSFRDGESGGGPSANVVAISAPFELSSEEEGESVPSQPVASGSSGKKYIKIEKNLLVTSDPDQQNAQRCKESIKIKRLMRKCDFSRRRLSKQNKQF